MKILLVDVDSIIPNIALEKLRFFYEQKHCKVDYVKDDKNLLPLNVDTYDKIYVSCVFTYNKYQCRKWRGIAEVGGSGYSVVKKLPAKIENVKPKINYGFTSRGCVRNCPWCIVQQKEGPVRVTGDIYDFWDGKTKDIAILDNNILGMPNQFFKLCKQIEKEHLNVDFNSGFDHRLLTPKIIDDLCKLKIIAMGVNGKTGTCGKLRFAFDHISFTKSVTRALKMLQKYGYHPTPKGKVQGLRTWQTRWYIYVGVNDTVKTVLTRVNIIRDAGQLVFVMLDRDKKVQSNHEFKKIYSWGCSVPIYTQVSYEEYCKIPKQKDNQPNLFKD